MIISIDAETDGLWGKPFSIAATVHNENGQEVDTFVARISDEYISNEWVIKNVLPTLDFPVTHVLYIDMLKDFSRFYSQYRENFTALWHMGHVVEAFLFRECVRLGFIGEWDAPYTPIEVSEVLRLNGSDPSSVDSYAEANNIVLPLGSTHNPLYDCRLAAAVYFHITKQ